MGNSIQSDDQEFFAAFFNNIPILSRGETGWQELNFSAVLSPYSTKGFACFNISSDTSFLIMDSGGIW
jgi:hypothetical protein